MLLVELFEGYWKNIDIQRQERPSVPAPVVKPLAQKFQVLINGKPWKKDGKLVTFTSHDAAQRSADTISARYMRTTQVLPV